MVIEPGIQYVVHCRVSEDNKNIFRSIIAKVISTERQHPLPESQ